MLSDILTVSRPRFAYGTVVFTRLSSSFLTTGRLSPSANVREAKLSWMSWTFMPSKPVFQQTAFNGVVRLDRFFPPPALESHMACPSPWQYLAAPRLPPANSTLERTFARRLNSASLRNRSRRLHLMHIRQHCAQTPGALPYSASEMLTVKNSKCLFLNYFILLILFPPVTASTAVFAAIWANRRDGEETESYE